MKATQTSTKQNGVHDTNGAARVQLSLVITEPNVVAYLTEFKDDDARHAKAAEALKVGVIAIQSASPILDTRVVEAKFSEMQGKLKDSFAEFQKQVNEELCKYLKEGDGVLPRSINDVFGDEGGLSRTFDGFFDPEGGKLARLMRAQVGPESTFSKAIDPKNKEGILTLIEQRVEALVREQLKEILEQFSLDQDGSAMSRLKTMLTEFFHRLSQSLGIKTATAIEAERGHVKGMELEVALYSRFAEWGRQIGDETQMVRGTIGAVSRCKKGDYVATLGDSSGAPGLNVAVEVKAQPLSLKKAIDELQDAKENREATVGILVFERGCEPAEIGDFRRIGEDFYCTVDRDDLRDGKPLMFFESAYKIARTLIVTTARKEAAGELDVDKIEEHLDALGAWSDRIADMATKGGTIQRSGKHIEECANALKDDMQNRLSTILGLIRIGTDE